MDHPRKGSKDLADAVCGSIYNAISLTRPAFGEVEVHTYDSIVYDNVKDEEETRYNMIRPPRIPISLANAIENMEII